MKKTFLFLLTLLFMQSVTLSQQVAKPEYGSFALTNVTIETVTNGTVQGTLLIRNGKIAGIGENVSIPQGTKVIDCTGFTVYPGMIDGGTTLGLSEVGSISLTQDYNEVGDFTPHVQALTAVNPNSVHIPVTRVNGVTTVLTMPKSGLFPGTASLIHLHGYTPQQMEAGFSGVVLNFPNSGRRGRWDRRTDEEVKKDYEEDMKKLSDIWGRSKQYAEMKDKETGLMEYNPEMDAMIPLVKGNGHLLIEVNKREDILSAIKWVREHGAKAIFMGVSEGWRVADSLAAADIPVITGPVLSVPGRASDRYDVAYRNAGVMQKAGVQVAIRTNESENVRNLPFNAGFAAAYGMGKKEALRAVTIVPAQIFGVDDQIGSLEVGKTANVIVSDGDPFETKTQFQHLFINGWKVPLESRHTLLYDEFLERSPGLRE